MLSWKIYKIREKEFDFVLKNPDMERFSNAKNYCIFCSFDTFVPIDRSSSFAFSFLSADRLCLHIYLFSLLYRVQLKFSGKIQEGVLPHQNKEKVRINIRVETSDF
jgi:hypothetical protein